ncbi:calpain C isoform X2 [Brevipalpus obovatus]|uniref:calpain C isoform X2 n=1 Tax=Brevipalpus obovatus TaxID=246614 RepID=UPI003D9EB7B7
MTSSDYEKIRRNLLRNGELYEDVNFPATQASVFYHQTPPFTFVWKRPKEICSKPVFLNDLSLSGSRKSFDIHPGKLGDQWLVSCMACLSLTKGLFYRVVPADQSFDLEDYCGLFRFRIWFHDTWEEVLVDDRLPCVNDKLVFIQSRSDAFWAALLEKAYAKLHGSYEALKYGSSIEGLSDLTGGVNESISLGEDSIVTPSLIIDLLSMTSIITAVHETSDVTSSRLGEEVSSDESCEKVSSYQPPEKKMLNKMVPKEILSEKKAKASKKVVGIDSAMSYRVVALHRMDRADGCPYLIKLHNPLIGDLDNRPKSSIDWFRLSSAEKNQLTCEEGEFWLNFRDFLKTFASLEVIHLDSETSKDEPSLRGKSPWFIKFWRGVWRRGVTAGGCRNNIHTFHTNPQLLLDLNQSDTIIVCLNQHSILEPKVIGFSVYAFNNQNGNLETRLDKSYFKRNRSLYNSLYTNTKQISLRCKLDEGKYVLIPTSFEPGQEGYFSIRTYSTNPIKLSFLDSTPSLLKPPIMKAPISFDLKFSQYEAMFLQIADEHKTISAFELQDLLDSCLPNDYVKSCATLGVCRLIIATLDTSGTLGRLKYSDYKNIMCSLRLWQTIFRNHTKGTSGILRADSLKEALHDVSN